EEEERRPLHLPAGDRFRLEVFILGHRVLPRLPRGRAREHPRILQWTLRQVRDHRLDRSLMVRQVQAVRFVDTLERRPGAVSGVRRAGDRDRLAIRLTAGTERSEERRGGEGSGSRWL